MHPVGCLPHPDVEWDFEVRREGVVAHIVVVPVEGLVARGKEEYSQSLSTS